MISSGFPRASDAALLASSPLIVPGVQTSSTAVVAALSARFASGTSGIGLAGVHALVYDGTNFQFAFSASAFTDGNAGGSITYAGKALFNGSTWDRARNNAAAVITATTQPFAQLVANPGEWATTSAPGTAAQATASKAAGAAGVRHVARAIVCTLGGTANSGSVKFNLRDGATGAGTVLWSIVLYALANSAAVVNLSGLSIFGSAATAMTLETSAATAANVEASVSLSGYDTQ